MKKVITKDFCREFDRSPEWLRIQLRKKYVKPIGNHWEWDEREARKVRKWLRDVLERRVKP